MKSVSHLAIALEAIGVIAIIAGITIEATMQADIGFMAITGGSVLIASGALIWGKLIKKR
jgi:hypothetical protein